MLTWSRCYSSTAHTSLTSHLTSMNTGKRASWREFWSVPMFVVLAAPAALASRLPIRKKRFFFSLLLSFDFHVGFILAKNLVVPEIFSLSFPKQRGDGEFHFSFYHSKNFWSFSFLLGSKLANVIEPPYLNIILLSRLYTVLVILLFLWINFTRVCCGKTITGESFWW